MRVESKFETFIREVKRWWNWNNPKTLWHRLTSDMMGRCKVCNRKEDVICYDPRGLWAYPIRTTVCPTHCEQVYGEHDWHHDRYEGWICNHCAIEPPLDAWMYNYD